MEHLSAQPDFKPDYLTSISEYAHNYKIHAGGNRFFPALVQQVAEAIGDGLVLTASERAAIHAGILSVSETTNVEIPQQKTYINNRFNAREVLSRLLVRNRKHG